MDKNYKYNNSASEELANGAYDFPVYEKYHLIKIGATTVNQLREAKIIPQKNYGDLSSNKPDALIMRGKNNVQVLIEMKKPGTLKNDKDGKNVITEWYYELAKILNCKIICASDGLKTCWVHSPSKNIISEEGEFIKNTLDVSLITGDGNKNVKRSLEQLIDKLNLSDKKGNIKSKKNILNPQKLADRVWQKIWIQTGKNPESCLYNVVEIFIFKYLSDLKVLPQHMSFETVYDITAKKVGGDAEEGLRYYADNVRKIIRTEMFPAGEDGTTILNGTIFVNEKGKPNYPQAGLFKEVLTDFYKYGKEEGAFINIDKSFKTRLYESFLRKEAGISTMGQYFTPRNVVQAIIEMCPNIPTNSKICDPFCGVGGFLLELLNSNDSLKTQYKPTKDDEINPQCEIFGFDKGTDETDDARTIILAKANMLIYLSDIIAEYPQLTKEFSNIFNKTFHLLRSNVGTFEKTEYKDYFDFIFTNPPYVVKGVSSVKKQLKTLGVNTIYESNGKGLEGLALDWIVYSLKPGGKAFIVLPTGVFRRIQDKNLRHNILNKCYIDGIISLPEKTFYATTQKTYILSITKKNSEDESQTTPVFAFIAKTIGETLDSYRFPTDDNDLIRMAQQYKYFCADKNKYQNKDKQIKIIPFCNFIKNWIIEDHWSEDELIKLGLKKSLNEIEEDDFKQKTISYSKHIKEQAKKFKPLNFKGKVKTVSFYEILCWEKGSSKLTKDYMRKHIGPYPVYTADTLGTLTSGIDIDKYKWEGECIRLTTNGEYAGTFTYISGGKYSMNGDAGRITVKDKYKQEIYLQYIMCTLQDIRRQMGFEWVKKPRESEILSLQIPLPIKEDGIFDIKEQKKIAQQYKKIEDFKNQLKKELDELTSLSIKLIPD